MDIGGPLVSGGWRKPSDVLNYDATDSAGVRAVRFEMAGKTGGRASCDYHLPAPCPARRGARLLIPDDAPDGSHTARIVAEDAAGNEKVVQRQISVDGTPPGAVIERARGGPIVLSLTDNASGVTGAALEVRRNSNEPYRTLNARIANGRLRARLNRGNASRIDMRVTVTDAAGNVAQGNPTRLTATSAKIGRRFRRIRSGRVTVPFGAAPPCGAA